MVLSVDNLKSKPENAACGELITRLTSYKQQSANGLDAVLAGTGLDQSQESEGHDRTTIELPGDQNTLVEAICNTANGVRLVCFRVHRGNLGLGDALNQCGTIVDLW